MKSSFDLTCLNWKTNQRLGNFPFCDSEFSLPFLSFFFFFFFKHFFLSLIEFLDFFFFFFLSLYIFCFSYFLFLLFLLSFILWCFCSGILSFISFLSFFLFYPESWIFPEFSFILFALSPCFLLLLLAFFLFLSSFLLFSSFVFTSRPSSRCPSLRFSCCGPEEPEDQDEQRCRADHQGRQFCFHPCAESADHMLRGGAHQPETGLDKRHFLIWLNSIWSFISLFH